MRSPLPPLFPKIVGQQHADDGQGDEEPEPRTGGHDLKLGEAHVDDVALAEGGQAEQMQKLHPDARGKQLHAQGQAPVEVVWWREGHEQQGKGEEDDLELAPAEQGPAHAEDGEPQRNVQGQKLPAKLTQQQEEHGRAKGPQPGPGSSGGDGRKLAAPLPDKVGHDKGDQVAVVEIRPAPLVAHLPDDYRMME
jgi:hypothetical protein